MDPNVEILLGLFKFASAIFFFFSLWKMDFYQWVAKFKEDSTGKLLMLFISGIYVAISLLELLPFSENELHKAEISHKYMPNYLISTLSFGVALLVDKIIGYDHEEQQDNKQDLQQVTTKQLKKANELTQDIEMKLLRSNQVSKEKQVEDPRIEEANLLKKDLNKTNFIYIYFYILLIGVSLGGSYSIQHFCIELICSVIIVYILTCRLKLKFNEDQLAQDQLINCIKLLLSLLSIGILCGTFLSFIPSHISSSYLASANSGNLLYIATMKLIRKNYDTSRNQYTFFFAFFSGYAIISASVYGKILS